MTYKKYCVRCLVFISMLFLSHHHCVKFCVHRVQIGIFMSYFHAVRQVFTRCILFLFLPIYNWLRRCLRTNETKQ